MKLYEDLEWRGLIKDISSEDLRKKLNEESLTFYIGTDPTGDSMHIGHFSSFLIAARLKNAGHNPLLLIGGATGLIGDPKPTSERTIISKEEVDKNVVALSKQAKEIFGFEIVNNYDWCKEFNFIDYLRDYGKFFTVNYMIDKDIIKRRLATGITYTEFSYMIMQALDFETLYREKDCVLQVAGSDQWGNITAGIDLVRKKLGKEAYGFTMPLILDKNGNKFGKTEGNAVWLDKDKTSSYEMYQFLFNSDDTLVIDYLKKLTFLTKEEIESIEEEHNKAPEKRIAQIALCENVITYLHSKEDYLNAKKISESLFSEKIYELSSEDIINSVTGVNNIKVNESSINLVDFLVNYNVCSSKREAREMVSGNAITINGKKVNDLEFSLEKEDAIDKKVYLLKKGKKNYYLITY
ncbi:MAG: tyrosine--tRNA ligase [bacterium]